MMLSSPERLTELLGVPFSREQLTAITAPLEPAVIIAGAGTGKTTVMAARVVWLVGTGQVRPEQVLGLTFTRKAALELSQRVDSSLQRAGLVDDEPRQTVLTYDAFAGRLLADHGLRIGVETDQTLITGATRFRLAAQAVQQHQGALPRLSRLTPAVIAERVLKLDAELTAHLVTADQLLAHDRDFSLELSDVKLFGGKPTAAVSASSDAVGERGELLELVQRYRVLKAQLGLVEFADQMAQAANLVKAAGEVADQLRERFAVVLLDEYQDTSAAQAGLLRGLFGGGHPVTAVGDPFQAIYGWRGAAPSNILQFAADFARRDGQPAARYSLQVNRRSREAILQAANIVAAPLRADERLRNDEQLRPAEQAAGGLVRVASFDSWPEEVEWIADQVVSIHQDDPSRGWSQMAVLTRVNQPIGALFEALAARDVPVEIIGLGGLLEVPEIAEIVATLQLIDDVTANPEVVRLLSGPRWRIGPRDLRVLGERARQLAAQNPPVLGDALESTAQLCLMDAVEDLGNVPLSASARERLAEFAAELAALRAHRDEPVLELVQRVIASSGIARELDSDTEWWATGRSRQLTQFVDAVADYVDIDGDGALSGLLAWLTAEREQAVGLDQAVPSRADSVKLLTAHRAKGLEWDVVFLPGLSDGVFPSSQPPDNWTRNAAVLPAELRGDREWVPQLCEVTTKQLTSEYGNELRAAQRQTEDRLIYVAVTRARELLIASHHYWTLNRKTARQPSPYFKALAEQSAQCGAVIELVEPSEVNPLADKQVRRPWPSQPDTARLAAAQQAAAAVARARSQPMLELSTGGLDAQELGARWHGVAEALIADARARRARQRTVPLPESMSASALLLANRAPASFANQLMRPMPRPTGMAAGVGNRFHQWLEQYFGMNALFDPDELIEDDPPADQSAADLALQRLTKAFENGQYANRSPLCVEEPFILVVADQQIRGRIDAVFATPDDLDHDFQVVDWKTSTQPADALQLSLYRLAWAHSNGVPLHRVDAVFFHVLNNRVERPDQLLDESALAELLDNLAS